MGRLSYMLPWPMRASRLSGLLNSLDSRDTPSGSSASHGWGMLNSVNGDLKQLGQQGGAGG